ncbi:trigger factor [Rippkaea orientalis PCC 8801]|uniref:Trigger factor n=1 Tax=Rippkaea orientalis (strain PCC 8801 / RF-1) TaxID=41431 RepID=TIG_RIPO1|nr:trigger factor [Rippkaea orientalis]B7JW76.1 RecName: Full=Trigger factor; Short=TF; AltName: Full=PPIase [Rippkaea orientalis PCC 8801]ACK66921.1 trigger factor [Rippkaea orientalis PCC 8801]
MKVTQEKLPDSQIGLEIEISAEASKKAYETKVNTLARTANIPGFRKGKVPRQILLQRIGTEYIKATTLQELIEDSLKAAIKQESLESIGDFELKSKFDELVQQFKPGEPLTFSAAIDVPPTVTLGDYQSLSVKAEETVYNPEKLENWFKERQEQQATLVPVEDRKAEMGDVAIVDYEGYFAPEEGEETERKPIPGVQGQDFRVDLTEGRFIQGMVEGIVGMQPEETQEITVTFPSDYPREDLAGQVAIFKITVKELKAKELPELDDDFAEEVSEFATIAELRESLEKQFTEEAQEATKKSIHDAMITQLLEICPVDLPNTLIEDEVTQVLTQTAMQMEQMGIDIRQLFVKENIPKLRENARPDAISRLKQSLILQEIAKVESITPEASLVEERINKIKEQLSERDVDFDKLEQMVTEELTMEAILNWLQEKATVELVPEGTLKPAEDQEAESQEE